MLKKENAELEEKANTADKGKFSRTLEIGKLQSEVREMHRFIDSIPPDILQELKNMQKQNNKNRGYDR